MINSFTPQGELQSSCTGTLISNFEGTATYVLAADHCFDSKEMLHAGFVLDMRAPWCSNAKSAVSVLTLLPFSKQVL